MQGAVWTYFPSGRHTHRDITGAFVAGIEQSWTEDRLGYWAVRPAGAEVDESALIGVGGCTLRYGLVWNLYYRLAPSAWGRGVADEIAAAGLTAAAQVNPGLPVVAYMVAHNTLSAAVAVLIGSIELIGVLHDKLDIDNPVVDWIADIDLGNVGFIVVGLFLVVWAAAIGYWKWARVEEKWALPPAS